MMDVMSSTPRLRRVLATLAVTAVVAAGAGACNDAPTSVAGERSPSAVPAPVLLANGGASPVRWDSPLSVSARNGVLKAAEVVDQDGTPVAGEVSDHQWVASIGLFPDASYRVTARVADLSGSTRVLSTTLRTARAARTLHARLSPGDGKVVGVGQPVIVTLDRPVTEPADRAAVLSRLGVTTVPTVAGAWRWMSPTELHYRGPGYWAKGTRITVTSDLARLHLSDDTWGEGAHSSTFQIGSSVISTVDVKALTMRVVVDGKLVRVVKVSTGRDKYPTKGGVHLVLEKVKVEVMDSATVGIPRNSPAGYYEKVPNSIRISYGGAFVHSAAWSVRDQGVRNVSHGCVNISPADAAWFFGISKRGDVVDIVNAKAPPLLSDPGMWDWNIPFRAWPN